VADSVTVTSRQSWFSRLRESIKSVLFGLFLFVAGFPLLFWNEGRAVRTAKSLEEGAGIVMSVSPDVVDVANGGTLVHVSGFAKTDDSVEDQTFGVSENAIRLSRHVEMFQWVESKSSETEKNLGGSEETTTTYDYTTEWRDSVVDSSKFESPAGHENPRTFPYDTRSDEAANVSLGAFTLSASQVARLHKSEDLHLDASPGGIPNAQIHDGVVYLGADPGAPSVGDARVRFTVVRPGPVSIVARQVGSSFEPYQAEAGGSVSLLEEALVSADAMFASAQRSNTIVTWMVRLGGYLLMFVGLSMTFRPIAVVGDVVPLFGRLLGAGVGIFSAFVAAFFAFSTMAVAWFAYRPLLGITLLVMAGGAVYLLIRAVNKKSSSAAPPPPLPPLPG